MRARLVVLATIGFIAATYLALFQLGVTTTAWDPIFGAGSTRVLGSWVARTFPVPDALLGALAYALEIVLGLIGDRDRWRTLPIAVLLYGVTSASLAATAVALLVAQPLVVGTWCSLCVLSALVSLLIFGPAMTETRAALAHLRVGRRSGTPLSAALFGRSGPTIERG